MDEVVRTFVAIDLPAEVRSLLAELQETLRGRGRERIVKWVDPPGIHLTLKFLGNVPAPRLPDIEEALRRAAHPAAPFALHTAELGVFPSPQRPRVIWVGVHGDLAALEALQRAVEEALRPLGFPPEGRPFSPHLTLGRVRDEIGRADQVGLAEALRTTAAAPSAPFPVHSLNLMRSDLSPRGASYRVLAVLALGRPGSEEEGK